MFGHLQCESETNAPVIIMTITSRPAHRSKVDTESRDICYENISDLRMIVKFLFEKWPLLTSHIHRLRHLIYLWVGNIDRQKIPSILHSEDDRKLAYSSFSIHWTGKNKVTNLSGDFYPPLILIFDDVQQRRFATGVQHSFFNGTLITGHWVDENCQLQKRKCIFLLNQENWKFQARRKQESY